MMRLGRSAKGAWFVLALLGSCLLSGSAMAQSWEVITKEQGIEVSRKTIEGRDMPIFRGKGVVAARLYTVMAVLQDFDRHKEWMHGCYEAGLLKEHSAYHRISYNRADAPWPVDDRDVVLESKVTINQKTNTVMIRFKGIKSKLKPEVDGVVRMPRLAGYYKLTAVGPDKTRVQYQVDADPGGLIPGWLAEQVSEEMPLNTLRNLRKQVKKVKGQYEGFMKQWDPKHNPESPGPKI